MAAHEANAMGGRTLGRPNPTLPGEGTNAGKVRGQSEGGGGKFSEKFLTHNQLYQFEFTFLMES